MTRYGIPADYAVVQLDDQRWYPVVIHRFNTDPSRPQTCSRSLSLTWFSYPSDHIPHSYATRADAVRACQVLAHEEDRLDHYRWSKLTAATCDLYPERCAHYLDLIEELTGQMPEIDRSTGLVFVEVSISPCWYCGRNPHFFDHVVASGPTIDEALHELTERVYAIMNHACRCSSRRVLIAS